jgi:hypothetical protein
MFAFIQIVPPPVPPPPPPGLSIDNIAAISLILTAIVFGNYILKTQKTITRKKYIS